MPCATVAAARPRRTQTPPLQRGAAHYHALTVGCATSPHHYPAGHCLTPPPQDMALPFLAAAMRCFSSPHRRKRYVASPHHTHAWHDRTPLYRRRLDHAHPCPRAARPGTTQAQQHDALPYRCQTATRHGALPCPNHGVRYLASPLRRPAGPCPANAISCVASPHRSETRHSPSLPLPHPTRPNPTLPLPRTTMRYFTVARLDLALPCHRPALRGRATRCLCWSERNLTSPVPDQAQAYFADA
jgi:hypothetical protein